MTNIIEVDLNTEERDISIAAPYQYDYGLMLRLNNAPSCPLLVEMCNYGDKKIKHDCQYSGEDIEIPDDLLRDGRDLRCYISVSEDDYFRTLFVINVMITKRPSR